MKYRRKPMIVEAVRWYGMRDLLNEPAWLTDAFRERNVLICEDDFQNYIEINSKVSNADELQITNVGDYIVRGAFGEIYSCRALIFEHDHDRIL